MKFYAPSESAPIPEKVSAKLKLTVYAKDSETETWKESAEVISISRTGAGFTLSRPCEVGRLLLVVLAMPRDLRAYDHETELYSVIGVVQHCHATTRDGATEYHVSLGFIGRETPASFKNDPLQSYCITGSRPDGMWMIKEVSTSFRQRKHSRYPFNIPVSIAIISRSDRTVYREKTVTMDVGSGGASVVTTLDGSIGDKVKFTCKDPDFYSLAVIKGRRENEGGRSLIHLQFLDAEFPVDRVSIAKSPEGR